MEGLFVSKGTGCQDQLIILSKAARMGNDKRPVFQKCHCEHIAATNYMDEKSAFRTSGPWLICRQEANARFQLRLARSCRFW